MRRLCVVATLGLGLAGCGGNSWPAKDAQAFLSGCQFTLVGTGSQTQRVASNAFCKCALTAVEKKYHNPDDLPDLYPDTMGGDASQHKGKYPACAGR